ncbi:hypothetical protein ACM44_14730 [Chryseobacterium koreense CCUG 49689]|uniref:Uncharacterized protein n=1 Tax=Chryseobacterium koreense CCUG 49689 TaxID=1304281 RepID=A0A0J7IP84_9FLAO|nr:hypothetical protein [Chryseobacterium koreense]KMQ67782.1 hypothetical protein ACM44_14730 [Chryseobacterium koreense CCUG 49689]MBB5334879.1 hypothetical protein [Chryseobacterium koreense]
MATKKNLGRVYERTKPCIAPRAKLTVLPNSCNASKETFPFWAEANVPSIKNRRNPLLKATKRHKKKQSF